MLEHFDPSLSCHYSRDLFEELWEYIVEHGLSSFPNRIAAIIEGKFIEIYQSVGVKLPLRSPDFYANSHISGKILVGGNDMYSEMLLQGYLVPEIADCARPCYCDLSEKYFYYGMGGLDILKGQRVVFKSDTVFLDPKHRLFLSGFKVVSNEYKEKLLAIL
jgi:hypothetical protein